VLDAHLRFDEANPVSRADMVYIEYPSGGAVFSTSSVAWCGCLSYNGYDNNVSRITRNVLDRFSPGS
jgi:N,N-dimethylformamidase